MKGKALKTIILVISFLIVSILLVGCNGSGGGEGQTPTVGEQKPTVSEEFKIFVGGEYTCKFVLPKGSSELEDKIAEKLAKMLTEKTGKEPEFINETAIKSDDKYLFMIGALDDNDSKAVREALEDRNAVAKTVGCKLIVAFSDEASGMGVLEALGEDMIMNSSGEIKLAAGFSKEYKALPGLEALPKYEYDYTRKLDCGEGSEMTYVGNGTTGDYAKYCTDVEAAGFKKIDSKDINGNLFTTFVGEEDYVYIYYTRYRAQIRIMTGPRDTLALSDYSSKLPENETPYLANIPQPKDGQGYIFGLPDGRFIIHDGGHEGNDRVYKTLRELKPTGDIVIAAWFVSHPHNDHYPALIDFIKDHVDANGVVIERIIHNYAHPDMYNITGTAGLDNSSAAVSELFSALKQYAPDIPVIKAHTGQVLDFGSATVEILYTIEDLLPEALPNINDS